MIKREGAFSQQGKEYRLDEKLLLFLLVRDLVAAGMGVKPAIARIIDEYYSGLAQCPTKADRRNDIERAHRLYYDWREEMILASDEEQIMRHGFAEGGYPLADFQFRERSSHPGERGVEVAPCPSVVVAPPRKRGRPRSAPPICFA